LIYVYSHNDRRTTMANLEMLTAATELEDRDAQFDGIASTMALIAAGGQAYGNRAAAAAFTTAADSMAAQAAAYARTLERLLNGGPASWAARKEELDAIAGAIETISATVGHLAAGPDVNAAGETALSWVAEEIGACASGLQAEIGRLDELYGESRPAVAA
jgi:hypothetical protein